MTATTIRAGRHTLRVSRPDKVLFPADGYTKSDLLSYYRELAPAMLRELRGRPLMLERWPDGIEGERFMQKEVPGYFPEWIHRATVPKEGGSVTHVVCDDTPTLAYLAGQACVTPHRWLARTGHPTCPDRLVFDLDPPGDDFAPVRRAAAALGELLDEIGLPSALMTTGSRGLHVIVPLDGRTGADQVRSFAQDVAGTLATRHPHRLTTATRKTARGDRLYLDVQRNAYAQTEVAPYAVRARPGAPVAAPVAWADLDDPELSAQRWALATAADHARTDPWQGVPVRGRAIGPAARRLRSAARE